MSLCLGPPTLLYSLAESARTPFHRQPTIRGEKVYRDYPMKTRLAAASLILAGAAAIFVFTWPLYSSVDGSRTIRATLLEHNRPWAIVPVMFPVLIALLPLVFPNQPVRIIAAIAMCAFSLLGAMTIGLFYVPAALLMLAACVADSAKRQDA